MVFKIITLGLAILGLVFVVGPFFDYAVFDFQCGEVGCNSCAANRVYEPKVFCESGDSATAPCNKGCKVRNLKCGFDDEFRSQCIKCMQNCKTQYSFNNEVAQELQECLNDCYNKPASNNS